MSYNSGNTVLLVCVDEYDAGDIRGRIYNSDSDDVREYSGAVGLAQSILAILDENGHPRSTMKIRSFNTVKEPEAETRFIKKEPDIPAAMWTHITGKIATFKVNVMFRQNASLQGSILWVEQDQKEDFRSAMELLLLMASAL